MIDLKNFGGGRKLIKKVMRQDNSTDKPWSQEQLFKKLKQQQNTKFNKPKT